MCRRPKRRIYRLVTRSVTLGHREIEVFLIRMERGLCGVQGMLREKSKRRDEGLQYRGEAVFECPSGDVGDFSRLAVGV